MYIYIYICIYISIYEFIHNNCRCIYIYTHIYMIAFSATLVVRCRSSALCQTGRHVGHVGGRRARGGLDV